MRDIQELRRRLTQERMALSRRKGERDQLVRSLESRQAELADLQERATVYDQVIALLQQTSEQARAHARERIERLVTNALQSVFGPEYAFVIELTEKAGRPEAEFYVVSTIGGEQVRARPQEARGGGVVDVVSLALRVAMLETYRPRLEGPLVLDEPAKHVSDEYIQPVAAFLKTVSTVFDRQIIMVTHSAHLAQTADVAYQVILKDGKSVATRTAKE